MAGRPPVSGTRVIAVLGLLLAAALGVVIWLASRPAPAPPKEPPVSARAPHKAAPVAPRLPRSSETVGPIAVPEHLLDRPDGGKAPELPDDRELVKLDVEVFGVSGLAAPGATVLLLDPFAQHAGPARSPELARVKADDTGHARFDVSGRMLRAFAFLGNEAGASDRFVASPERSRVAVRMSPAIAVHGRVVDPTGLPIAEASVRFSAAPWLGDTFGLLLETKSAVDGAFAFPSVTESAFEKVVESWIEARAKGWPASRVAVTPDSARAGEIVVVLERGGFVRGRLVREGGGPVSGEIVRVADGRSSVASEGDGRFELPLPRDGGVVVATSGEASPMAARTPQAGGGWGAAKILGRFRGDAGDIDLGEVTLSLGQSVKGLLVDLDDKPVKAGDVLVYLAGVLVGATQTDDAGRFELSGVSDDPHAVQGVEPRGANAAVGPRRAVVDDVRGGATDVRITLTGALTVVAKFLAAADRSRVVVPQVRLKIVPADATLSGFTQEWVGAGIDSARVEMKAAGSYDVTVEIPGYEPATAEGIVVGPDREARIEVLFRKLP